MSASYHVITWQNGAKIECSVSHDRGLSTPFFFSFFLSAFLIISLFGVFSTFFFFFFFAREQVLVLHGKECKNEAS